MTPLVIPDLDLLKYWLEQQNIRWFECDHCQALHLPHLQNFEGVLDARLDLLEGVLLLSAVAEIKLTALISLAYELSEINASSLTAKAFIDVQDDASPKLVVCQSLSVGVGVTTDQFAQFMQQSEEQISMIITEAVAGDLLQSGSEEENHAEAENRATLH